MIAGGSVCWLARAPKGGKGPIKLCSSPAYARYVASDGRELTKAALVLACFVLMLLWAYCFTVHFRLSDVEALAPGPAKGVIRGIIEGLPEGQRSAELPLPEVRNIGDVYQGTVLLPGEMAAMPWVLNNTTSRDKFVADIFGAELIMGMTARVSTEGGDWAYATDMPQLCADTHEIFKTDDPARASTLAKKWNATCVFLPRRTLNTGWWQPQSEINATKFEDTAYFTVTYRNDDVTIYQII